MTKWDMVHQKDNVDTMCSDLSRPNGINRIPINIIQDLDRGTMRGECGWVMKLTVMQSLLTWNPMLLREMCRPLSHHKPPHRECMSSVARWFGRRQPDGRLVWDQNTLWLSPHSCRVRAPIHPCSDPAHKGSEQESTNYNKQNEKLSQIDRLRGRIWKTPYLSRVTANVCNADHGYDGPVATTQHSKW